jgi:hypothetical protein
MTENIDTLLLRGIFDWSRPDGNVWSQQIVWSGSFADSQRLVQLMEVNSPSIEVRIQHFDLHTHLRELFIARHANYFSCSVFANGYYFRRTGRQRRE